MLLALGTSNRDQGSNVEPLGLSEDGSCNINRIIVGELTDAIDGGVLGIGQAATKFRACRDLKLTRELLYHQPKDPDLLLRVLAS